MNQRRHHLAVLVVQFPYRRLTIGFCLLLVGLTSTSAEAGSHHELNWIPMGYAQIPKGSESHSFMLPPSASGHLPLGIVLVSSRPKQQMDQSPVVGAEQPAVVMRQIPAKLKFKIGSRSLPDWELQDFNTAYVISLSDIRSNPGYAEDVLITQTELETEADGIAIPMIAMPDVLVLGSESSGPLSTLIQSATDQDAKAFLQALYFDLGSDRANAHKAYSALIASENSGIARMARRSLRKLVYEVRPHNPSGNFNDHYRWGLYLQQCGLFSQSFREFNDARIILPDHADAHYRAGEMAERINAGPVTTFDFIQRAGAAALHPDPAVWYALVVVERSRDDRKLTNKELRAIKENWLIATGMVWGATGGRLRIATTFFEAADSGQLEYVSYAPGLEAPREDLIAHRGWFDSVVSIRPRLKGEENSPTITIDPDQGPRGAALTGTYEDNAWPQYIGIWFDHYRAAVNRGELIRGIPQDDVLGAFGTIPPHNIGTSVRSILRYHLSGNECKIPKIVDVPRPGSYVTMWQIESPVLIKESRPANGQLSRNAMNAISSVTQEPVIRIAADTDFINLAHLYPNAGWAVARATTWVYSPNDQALRMWIGQNDGVAIQLNGRCIHRGDIYSVNRLADLNLVDTVAGYAYLKKGWNEVVVACESWPAPFAKSWGFSLRFCRWDNEPVPGLAYVNVPPSNDVVATVSPPQVGTHYDWHQVKEDFRDSLPTLTASDLERHTGLRGMQVMGRLDPIGGFIAVAAEGIPTSTKYRPIDGQWKSATDRDVEVNNVMDWMRESIAVLPFEKDGSSRALLFIKPEAVEVFTELLREQPQVGNMLFSDRLPSQRMLGFVRSANESCDQIVFVIDANIGKPESWPSDEDDLLEPISPVFVPNPRKVIPKLQGPPSAGAISNAPQTAAQ